MGEGRRLAFLGIGHPLRRDDFLGPELCERLRPVLGERADVLIVNGGPAPENCVGQLRAFAPDRVIVIDAARMGEPPGTLRLVESTDPNLPGASTHTLPLPVFCRYLETTLGCEVTILGIEPGDTSFGEGLSPAVEKAVEQAIRFATAEVLNDPPHPGHHRWVGRRRPHSLTPSPRRAGGATMSRGGDRMGEGGIGRAPIRKERTP